MQEQLEPAPYLALGIRIIKYRVRNDLLQRELAALMDIDAATLSKLEAGKIKATKPVQLWLSVNANMAMYHWAKLEAAAKCGK